MSIPKKGEIRVYYDVSAFDWSGMYETVKYCDSYKEALKVCSDLDWKYRICTSYGEEVLDCKIIKVTSEVLT